MSLTHISIKLRNVQGLYNNVNIYVVFLHLTVMNQPYLEFGDLCLYDSNKPVDHYEWVLRLSPTCKCILSIFLWIPTMLPPIHLGCINYKLVLFPILNDGPCGFWTADPWIHCHSLYHLCYQPLTKHGALYNMRYKIVVLLLKAR